jgi:DNA-directed RNA polymerase subunit E"
MRGRACRDCYYIITKGSVCPVCKGTSFSTRWNGLLVIMDPEKSAVADKLNITKKGKYALRVS